MTKKMITNKATYELNGKKIFTFHCFYAETNVFV